ncbi:hypothetical protein CKJ80_01675 [Corynebacterium hadale]|uniref:Uncharacterized protein n=1 Tax=Corynebacterium hadale TaxID=2026255 RepID=A0AB36RP12_9CORY|nr:hypothetical protein CKJ80_01675 [Corynebacterium hadale]PAT15698.1 hypothetical protein CKJ84_05520 [Corynebacterium sp. NML 120412]
MLTTSRWFFSSLDLSGRGLGFYECLERLRVSLVQPLKFALVGDDAVENVIVNPGGFLAVNGNRIEVAGQVDNFVRAFPVQDDQVIKFRVVRVFSSRLNSDFPNYAQFTNDMNLDLATLFSQLAGISATSTVL